MGTEKNTPKLIPIFLSAETIAFRGSTSTGSIAVDTILMNAASRTDRRDFFHLVGLGVVGWQLGHAFAAEPIAKTSGPPAIEPLNRFPRMMQDWLGRQVRKIETQGNLRRAAIKTKADAEVYVGSVRERIRECFGPELEKTPLNARVTGIVERDN